MSRMLSTQEYKFETLDVTKPRNHVLQVNINRPEKRNAMNKTFWRYALYQLLLLFSNYLVKRYTIQYYYYY